MDDLVKRLRDDAWLSRATNNETELFRAKLPDEAADAIEALQARVAKLEAEAERRDEQILERPMTLCEERGN